MDHPKTDQERAAEAVQTALTASNVARAIDVCDALDAHGSNLTAFDRHDFAYAAWERFTDAIVPPTPEDIARVMIRAARHLYEFMVADLIDIQFGEHEKRVTVDGGTLGWQPDARAVVIHDRADYREGDVIIASVYRSTSVRAA
ncbi:hypothetical protein [Microbacterium oleivorans]|uniref:Uncharacterized protein n=1 Tax=Microbacterium oleivorans TaxID=273677 RepID=A0A4R5YKP7_9MICO|nr:hypothetical protein [Microbacterium oleivorans]TDL43864.1 hypothetical protein E2R54_11785 [Microbacterium oleivorans]